MIGSRSISAARTSSRCPAADLVGGRDMRAQTNFVAELFGLPA
jgi:hypothetical protein